MGFDESVDPDRLDTTTPEGVSAPIFQHAPEFSYGDTRSGCFLVHGDNSVALDALRSRYSESIRCAYIDPPYNNGESYRHYFDNMGHEEWLRALTARIRQIWDLLRGDGSLWVSIDDNELHYLKVACDEIFGRKNFVATIVWEHRTTRENRKVFSNNHEYLLVYAKDYRSFKRSRNGLPLSDEVRERYTNPDNDPRGPWQSVTANVQAGHGTQSQHYEIIGPSGRRHTPPPGRCWVYTKDKMQREIDNNNVWFGKNGDGAPRLKCFLSERTTGMTPETLWKAEAVGTTDHAKKQLLRMFSTKTPFDTPKPEQLLQRVIEISSDPGDIVLDAYLGSGTTAAVAHKTGRRYIGIECGDHVLTLCTDRLRQVIDGDQDGISEQVGWAGGGGFNFYSIVC